MPKSRTRKLPSDRSRPRNKLPASPMEKVGETYRIRPHVFDRLRGDDDLISLVRVGRLLNALTYMMDLILSAPKPGEPGNLRHFHRNSINSAAYIYEGYVLIDSLWNKYHSETCFQAFDAIFKDPDKARKRRMMKTIRDSIAFHLDSSAQATKAALKKLDLAYYALISGTDGTLGTQYFDLSDTVDINYILDELKKKDSRSEGEVRDELFKLIPELIREFAMASDEFVRHLSIRLKLIKP